MQLPVRQERVKPPSRAAGTACDVQEQLETHQHVDLLFTPIGGLVKDFGFRGSRLWRSNDLLEVRGTVGWD